MDSPYRPGFGARPEVLVGRERHLARAEAALTRVANSRSPASSALVLTGARGLGKTVTLGEIRRKATDRKFATATLAFDPVSDNVQLLAARLAEAVAPADKGTELWARFRNRLAGLSIEVNAGLVKMTSHAPERTESTGAVHRQVLVGLLVSGAELALERGESGLTVFLDELQEAPHDQLVVIANAIQEALAGDSVPLAVFCAGLPNTPEAVIAAASFTERFDFRALALLEPAAAERALLEPAVNHGVSWAAAAAEVVLDAAGGSPYLIQRLGDEAWVAANPQPGGQISSEAAEVAVEEVRQSLGVGMFRGRWAKATPAERLFMTAMAMVVVPGGEAESRYITAVLNRTTPQLSSVRKTLIDKGMIEAPSTGRLRFTMPGFAEFVRDQVSAPWYGLEIDSGTLSPEALPPANPVPELPRADDAD